MEKKICKKCKGIGKYETKPVVFGTGSMGYHLPASVGMALSKKVKNEEGHVYCLISDGELNVGSTWESLAIAKHQKLDNLTLLIDRNHFQAMSSTEDVLDMEPIAEKLKSFGWHLIEIDGHNHEEILNALQVKTDKPVVILANTIKGKGFSLFEGDNLWHYSHVNEEVLNKALEELK